LRVQVEVLAKGKDLKEALARLKERREAARARLTALGAAGDAVTFGEPSLGPEKTEQQRQFEAMMAQRMRIQGGGAKPAAKAKSPPPVTVSVTVRVDLPLKAADLEELLLRSQELQEKVKAADLGGLKEFEKLSPQEEELAEEAQAGNYGQGQNEPKRGEPVFAFVSRVPEGEYTRALAEAFQKAQRAARELARAARMDLAELRHLESQAAGSGDEPGQGYGAYYGRAPQARLSSLGGSDPQVREAIGTQPGTVTYRIAVTASFALKPSPGN
jgi:hypothetical protein